MFGASIGTIVGWLKNLNNTPPLLDGWMECNGATVNDSDSPFNGQSVPNINGTTEATKKFLRGASGTTGLCTSVFQHSHAIGQCYRPRSCGCPNAPNAANTRSHVPPYYEVVWVIKIK